MTLKNIRLDTICMENCFFSCDSGQDKTEWKGVIMEDYWFSSDVSSDPGQGKMTNNQYNYVTRREIKMTGSWTSFSLHGIN